MWMRHHQNAALHAVVVVIDALDEDTIRRTIIPKTKQVFESNENVQVSVQVSLFKINDLPDCLMNENRSRPIPFPASRE